MGYYVYGNGDFTINSQKEHQAYRALCELNKRDELKHGGSWGAEGKVESWFSWMRSDYPEHCKTLVDILTEIGFDVEQIESPEPHLNRYSIRYDSKMGQEELFLEHLAPFVEEGSIEWSGEDNEYWKHVFKNKKLVYKRGVIKYV